MQLQHNVESKNQENSSKGSDELVVALYNEAKSLYKYYSSETNAEQRLHEIRKEFSFLKNDQGFIYCSKGIAIIRESRGDNAPNAEEKKAFYEEAHDIINETVLYAKKIEWVQPSLLKRQAVIKSKLADALHNIGNHHDANLLEKSAFKTLGEMLQAYPDYGEGSYTAVATSFRKLKWSLKKMLVDLSKTESLLKKPKHAKHQPESSELQTYIQDIQKMRNTISTLLSFTN